MAVRDITNENIIRDSNESIEEDCPFEKASNQLCELVDKFADATFEVGSPEYNYQQEMIQHVKTYRESKQNSCKNKRK